MDIPWRSSLLFIVAVAGILFAVATRSLVVLQGLTMLAFAILGVLAVVLVRRGARSIPSDPRLVRVAERLRELRRLAASARQDFPEHLDGAGKRSTCIRGRKRRTWCAWKTTPWPAGLRNGSPLRPRTRPSMAAVRPTTKPSRNCFAKGRTFAPSAGS